MSSPAVYPTAWKPPGLISNPAARRGLVALVVLYLLWSFGTIEVDWPRVGRGFPRAADLFSRMFPPDFSRWELLLNGVGVFKTGGDGG